MIDDIIKKVKSETLKASQFVISSEKQGLYKGLVKEYKNSSPEFEIDSEVIKIFKTFCVQNNIWLISEGYFEKRESFHKFFMILDPVDGTLNFSRGIEFFTIALSLGSFGDNEHPVLDDIEYSIIINSKGEIFEGRKNGSASKNGKKLEVSNIKYFADAIVRIGKIDAVKGEDLNNFFLGMINLGCTSWELNLLAEGKIDIYLEKKQRKIFDFAASYLIIKEAGGTVLSLNGEEISGLSLNYNTKSTLIFTNSHININELKKILL
ncbi:inositol monophosphatase family protein [Zunongwangia profunda]|uniref:inositol monophosphatase family protein n=1 Tax=Zunongwangia profunda TaxID=398743 RepID=UPI0030DBD924